MVPSYNKLIISGLAMLCTLGAWMAIGMFLLPSGVNRVFVSKALLPVAAGLIGVGLIQTVRRIHRPKGAPQPRCQAEQTIWGDLLLLLLPLTPIVQYILANQDMLSIMDSALVFLFFSAIIGACCIACPGLLSLAFPRWPNHIIMLTSVGLAHTMFNMGSYSSAFGWYQAGIFKVQGPILLVTIAALTGVYAASRKTCYAMVVGMFSVSLIAGWKTGARDGSDRAATAEVPPAPLLSFLAGKHMLHRPDVFLLIYESYANRETLDAYGFDNSPQTDFLESHGFHIYEGTYTVGACTLKSMSRVLHPVRILPHSNYRLFTAGYSAVPAIFKEQGYQTTAIIGQGYVFQRTFPAYDYYYPKVTSKPAHIISRAIWEGEFRFDISFDATPYDSFLAEKRDALSRPYPAPIFCYCHNRLPGHSQNSGICRPDETQLYLMDVVKANQEMQVDVQTILQHHPDAIIILAGDHGPYLTKNCFNLEGYPASEINRLDIQDRYGSFLAIRWPDPQLASAGGIQILQDIFPVIFAHLFQDASILDARIEPLTLADEVCKVQVDRGIITGGPDKGTPLFLKYE